MSGEDSELKNIVEAALLAAEEPLSVSALSALFPEDAAPTTAQLREVFEQLDRDYEGRGVELRRVGKGYRFQSREKYSPWLRKLSENRPPRYSRAFLETLAIIAYRQPVTRGDIEEIRGVTVSTDIVRGLLDREWIKQVGQRDVPGRPALFGTTQKFLEYFNIEALGGLPPLLERREATDIARELNLRLPLDEQEDVGGESENVEHAEGEEPSGGDGEPDLSPGESAGHDSRQEEDGEQQDSDEPGPRHTAQVIPIDDALTSREGDGEAT